MKDNESYGFEFNDTFEDIMSSSKPKEIQFEDIVSDTKYKTQTSGRYRKKKHGIAGAFDRFGAWWRSLTKRKRRVITALCSVLLVVCLAAVWFFSYFGYNYNSIAKDPEKLGFTGTIDKNVINVALFGIDTRDEKSFKGNSDSIMILSINTKTKKVKIFSIMRDTFVAMENEGNRYYGKINSAYSKGPEHAIKTINQNFDLDIKEYATVNFYGMTDIIDAVGGITATITEDELTWKGNDHPNLNNCMDEICAQMGLKASNYYIKSAGEQQLNGVQAVAYARVRHCTSVWGTRDDFGRTDRQRHVMQQLFNKALTMKKTQYTKLVKALIPCTETSLSYADIMSVAFNIMLSSPTFEQYRLPPAEHQSEFLMTGPSGYGSIIYYDLEYASKLLRAIIYDDVTMEQYIEENGVERNSWYSGSANKPSSNTQTNNNQTPPEPQPEPDETPDISSEAPSVSDESEIENASSEESVSSNEESSSDQQSSDIASSEESSSDQQSSDVVSSEESEPSDFSETSSEGTSSENSSN